MGLPVWRSPSPTPKAQDATKPSRSPIRRPRRQRSSLSTTAARLETAASGSISQRYPVWEHARVPERREEVSAISRPSRPDGSQSSSLLPLPPAPELRNLTRSPISMTSNDDGNLPYGRIPRPNPLPEPTRAYLERTDDPRRRYMANRRPEERLAPIWGQSFRRMDDIEDEFSPELNTSAPRSTDVLDNFDFDALLETGGFNWGRDTSPRIPAGAVEDFPPLRRMVDAPLPPGGSREVWDQEFPVDGLGDRSRSFSPASDHWETMLTTIAPDVHLPSVDSSFTSAAASASFSASRSHSTDTSSNSASSSRTSLTVPSEQDRERDQACETDNDQPRSPRVVDPLTAGIRQRDSDRRIRRTDSFRRLRERRAERASLQALMSPPRQRMHIRGPLNGRRPGSTPSPRRVGRDGNESSGSSTDSSIEPSRRRYRYGSYSPRRPTRGSVSPDHISTARRPTLPAGPQSLQDYLRTDGPDRDDLLRRPPPAPLSQTQLPPPSLRPEETRGEDQDHDLDSMRAIVERLAQRDDIPDSWWMSVGLTPMFAGRIERVRRERETRERL